MDKPDVDFIEGLSPAISIDQKRASRNPRSTVGTITEVYDYLRLLYARIGVPHCPNDGAQVMRQTPQQIVDRILELPEGTRFQVLAPVVRGRKGTYETLLADLAAQGFARARVDGEVHETHRQGRAGPLRAAHDRGGRRPAGPCATASSGASPTPSRPPYGWPTAWPRSSWCRVGQRGETTARRTPRATASRREAHVLPAPGVPHRRGSRSTSWRPATSRSTRPTAPARRATASAPATRSTPSWSSPNPDAVASTEGAIAPWAAGTSAVLPAPRRGRGRRARHRHGDALRQADGQKQRTFLLYGTGVGKV